MPGRPKPMQRGLRDGAVLPLIDSLFGVSLSRLAVSVPADGMGGMDAQTLVLAVGIDPGDSPVPARPHRGAPQEPCPVAAVAAD